MALYPPRGSPQEKVVNIYLHQRHQCREHSLVLPQQLLFFPRPHAPWGRQSPHKYQSDRERLCLVRGLFSHIRESGVLQLLRDAAEEAPPSLSCSSFLGA